MVMKKVRDLVDEEGGDGGGWDYIRSGEAGGTCKWGSQEHGRVGQYNFFPCLIIVMAQFPSKYL